MPHFTKDYLLGLKPTEKEYKVTDEVRVVKGKAVGVPGLFLRVFPSGVKTFAFQYRHQETGRKAAAKIGRLGLITLDQAREKAAGMLSAVGDGEDPARERREARNAMTVEQLAKQFLEEYVETQCKPRTVDEYRRLIKKFIIPGMGKEWAREVGPARVSEFLKPIRKATPIQANRIKSCGSKMFNMAEVWEIREPGTNPWDHQTRAPEDKREIRLDEQQIRTLGEVLRQVEKAKPGEDPEPETAWAVAAIRLILLAGPRKGEILGARWDWVDLEAGLIRIPPGMHKTGKKIGTRLVYLCGAAVEILKALPRGRMPKDEKGESPWVICGDPGKPLVQLQDAWERIRVAAQVRGRRRTKGRGPGPA